MAKEAFEADAAAIGGHVHMVGLVKALIEEESIDLALYNPYGDGGCWLYAVVGAASPTTLTPQPRRGSADTRQHTPDTTPADWARQAAAPLGRHLCPVAGRGGGASGVRGSCGDEYS